MEEHKFKEDIENAVASIVTNEYSTSKTNQNASNLEFESIIDILECKRSDKDYDWMADYKLNELPSIILTDASGWANQYFQTREFVKAKLEGNNPEDKVKCRSAEKLINTMLNNRDIHHYQKYIRGRTINSTFGQVYAVCEWNQKTKQVIAGYKDEYEALNVDTEGRPLVDMQNQIPAYRTNKIPVYETEPIYDFFNYDIVDPRNVFTDDRYVYSLQDKRYIIIRSERTYDDLVENQEKCGYINLDLVKEAIKNIGGTETSKETVKKNEDTSDANKTPIKPFDTIERWGKFPCISNKNEISPGYDAFGDRLDKSELKECIITFVITGNTKILIRFQLNPYIDSKGRTYRPIVRGLCYIHPTKDTGIGDGKYLRESEKAINDMFNMAMDRTKLATLPTLKARKFSLEGNTSIFFAPENVMEVENPDDIQEFKISDDIQGALEMINMLMGKGHQVTSVYPASMGDIPEKASTTATAFAGAQSSSNIRSNYKSLTYEYTFHSEFYWMMLQMTYQFCHPKTAYELMGDDAPDFDPNQDYNYTPVSSNIETEYNKYNKLKMIDQFVGRVVNVPNPNTPKLLNYLLKMAFELFDKEFPDYKEHLLDETVPPPMEGQQATSNQPKNIGQPPVSNQNMQPMGLLEQSVRGM
jgi:hypothetical protein